MRERRSKKRMRRSPEWYQFWRKTRYEWYVKLGLKSEKLRVREQTAKELAHYSKACADIEYAFPFSDEFQELEGVAHVLARDLGLWFERESLGRSRHGLLQDY